MDTADTINDCLKFYDQIKPKNQTNTYTVLAAIHNHVTGGLLALTTGTQACLRTYPDDIEDCHAESLLKRAYKRYLINKLISIKDRSEFSLARSELLREYRQGLDVFISQFPCGLISRYEGEEPVDEATGLTIRRKPGRGTVINGKTVYVERDCCLMKLIRWTSDGFIGRRLKEIIGSDANIIRRIIVGNCEMNNLDQSRFINEMEQRLKSPDVEIKYLESIRREEFVYSPCKQPQPVALVWWSSAGKEAKNLEFIVDGRKRGITKKQCLSDDLAFKLKVSNLCIRQDLDIIQQHNIDTKD